MSTPAVHCTVPEQYTQILGKQTVTQIAPFPLHYALSLLTRVIRFALRALTICVVYGAASNFDCVFRRHSLFSLGHFHRFDAAWN